MKTSSGCLTVFINRSNLQLSHNNIQDSQCSRIQVFIRLPQCQPVVHPEEKVISKTEIVTWRVQKDLVTNSEIKRERELFLPCQVFVLAPHKLHHHLESNLVPHYHHPDQVQLHALHPGGPIEQRTSKLQKTIFYKSSFTTRNYLLCSVSSSLLSLSEYSLSSLEILPCFRAYIPHGTLELSENVLILSNWISTTLSINNFCLK